MTWQSIPSLRVSAANASTVDIDFDVTFDYRESPQIPSGRRRPSSAVLADRTGVIVDGLYCGVGAAAAIRSNLCATLEICVGKYFAKYVERDQELFKVAPPQPCYLDEVTFVVHVGVPFEMITIQVNKYAEGLTNKVKCAMERVIRNQYDLADVITVSSAEGCFRAVLDDNESYWNSRWSRIPEGILKAAASSVRLAHSTRKPHLPMSIRPAPAPRPRPLKHHNSQLRPGHGQSHRIQHEASGRQGWRNPGSLALIRNQLGRFHIELLQSVTL